MKALVQKFSLGSRKCDSTSYARTSQSGKPAQIWLTHSLSDFSNFWPRSQRLEAARCYAFQCADILEVRCKTIAPARKIETLFVAVVDDEGSPLMLLPLGIERRFGVRILTFLDGGLSDYNSPIVFPATRDWREDDVRMIWRGLQELLPPFDLAILEKMPQQIGDLPNPLILLGTSPFPMSGHATTLSGTWHEFEAKRLPRRRTHRRYRRRLEERGKLTFEIAKTRQQVDTFLEALIRQKIRHHRETLTIAGFDQPGYRNFVTETTYRLPPSESTVHLSALKLDDTIIAAQWGYVVGSRFYYLIPSYEGGALHSFAPGHLLTEHLLEWSFAQGIEVFDFGVGDEDYKLEYCDIVIALYIAIIPVTFRGVAYSVVLKMTEKLKRSLKGTPAAEVLKSIVRRRPLSGQSHIEVRNKTYS
jgi:CelD/BcsL family acetyltransferase involved in cellulose biosynthesis